MNKRAKKEHVLVYFRTTQAVKWRTLLDVLAPILVDGNLLFDSKGLEIHGVAHTQWVKATLDNFEEYVYNMETPAPIGVNFDQFYKMYKGAKETDVVSLKITDDSLHGPSPHVITAIISDGVTIQGKLSILDIENACADMPAVVFDNVVDVLSSRFQFIIRLNADHGEWCQILGWRDGDEGDMLFFHTRGDTSGLTTCMGAKQTELPGDVKCDRKSSDKRESYRLHDLNLIIKATNLSKYMTVFLKPDYPIILRYNVGTLGTLSFALASRVELGDMSLAEIDIESYKIYVRENKDQQSNESEAVSDKEDAPKHVRRVRKKRKLD